MISPSRVGTAGLRGEEFSRNAQYCAQRLSFVKWFGPGASVECWHRLLLCDRFETGFESPRATVLFIVQPAEQAEVEVGMRLAEPGGRPG